MSSRYFSRKNRQAVIEKTWLSGLQLDKFFSHTLWQWNQILADESENRELPLKNSTPLLAQPLKLLANVFFFFVVSVSNDKEK